MSFSDTTKGEGHADDFAPRHKRKEKVYGTFTQAQCIGRRALVQLGGFLRFLGAQQQFNLPASTNQTCTNLAPQPPLLRYGLMYSCSTVHVCYSSRMDIVTLHWHMKEIS